jgi:hypothetical protein
VKVLIFSPEFPIDSETFIINQAIGLKQNGCEVDIFSLAKISSTVHQDKITKFNLMDGFRYLYTSQKNNLSIVLLCTIGLVKSLFYPQRWMKIVNVIIDRELFIKQKLNVLNYITWSDKYIGC